MSDGRRQCRRCRRKYTPARARGRLRTNLAAATVAEVARLFWLLVPAAAAARDLGLQRKTVTRLYDRLRRAIAARADREAARGRAKIHGSVEVDESYFGGRRKGKRGRGAAGKVSVFGLLKRRGGQVRVVFPDRLDRATLQGAIVANVRPASWVYSDGLRTPTTSSTWPASATSGSTTARRWARAGRTSTGSRTSGGSPSAG